MNLGNIRQLTKEETAELYATRTATLEQLAILAEKCGISTKIDSGQLIITNGSNTMWDPQVKLCQNHVLLSALISQGDCRLFYDDGVNEYFIYQYVYCSDDSTVPNPPIAHHTNLNDAVFDAAMNLWFPEA